MMFFGIGEDDLLFLQRVEDLVTEADLASPNNSEILLSNFESWIIGEEGDQDSSVPSLRWIVDPLDGTSNYVHGFPAYCVSVALAYDDEVLAGAIYDPVAMSVSLPFVEEELDLAAVLQTTDPPELSDALVAVSFPPRVDRESVAVADFLSIVPHVHSVRRTGSTAINLAYLAAGRLDGFGCVACVLGCGCWIVNCLGAGAVVMPCRHPEDSCEFPPQTSVSLNRPAFVAAANQRVAMGLYDLLTG